MKTIKNKLDELRSLVQVIRQLEIIKNLVDDKRIQAQTKDLIDEISESHMNLEHELQRQFGIEEGDYETFYKYIKD